VGQCSTSSTWTSAGSCTVLWYEDGFVSRSEQWIRALHDQRYMQHLKKRAA
jgi:hypothetical protein